MTRYLIPIVIALMLVSVFLLGCGSLPPSEPASSQESGLPTGSASSEYQQQISDLEQQIQSLSQQVGALEESISSLERKLETLPATTDSDFETRIEEQISQLGEQIDELGERLDGLNAEVVTIKQQLTEQEAEEETISSPSAPEAPPGTVFTFSGQGESKSLPFTIHSSPWKLKGWMSQNKSGSPSILVRLYDPVGQEMVGSENLMGGMGISNPETISYIPAGTYYLDIHTGWYVTWTVWIVEL